MALTNQPTAHRQLRPRPCRPAHHLNLREADTQERTAWLCAEMSGHAELRAWVASTRSKVAFWDGRLREAIQHARRGASCHPRGTVGALLACQEADAWSKLGAADETQAALHRAALAREDVDQSDDIGGIFSCPEARQENYAAGAHLRIGSFTDALTEADAALEHLRAQPVHAYGTEAQVHITRAIALLGSGQPEGIMAALSPALAMPPEQRLDPITQRIQDLAQLMAVGRVATGSATLAASTSSLTPLPPVTMPCPCVEPRPAGFAGGGCAG